MCIVWNRPDLSALHGVVFFSSMQKFAGANKLQQPAGNRSMSYLAGKADRCVVSLLSSRGSVSTPVPQSHGQSTAIVLRCWGSLSTFNGKQLHNTYSCSFGSLTSV